MYIVVSNDTRKERIPKELIENNVQVELWTAQEFIERATMDDGLSIDEGIFYDASILTEDIYEALKPFESSDTNLIYYRFEDTAEPSFHMDTDVVVYQVPKAKSVQDFIDENPISQPKIEEVIVEPKIIPTPEPEITKPTLTKTPEVTVPKVEPVINNIPQQSVIPQPPVIPQMPTIQQAVVQQPTIPQPVIQPTPVIPNNTQSFNIKPNSYTDNHTSKFTNKIERMNIDNILQHDDYDSESSYKRAKKKAPAKVILFGSSKGGTGKTFTCLCSAYWYAKNHPNQKIALADFDIIDGQIGITINKLTPTLQEYYKLYRSGHKDFNYLENCKVKSDHFGPNIDFYLAPSQDIPQVTNDVDFWNEVFQTLIMNYDIVFFDSGIDYLGKTPISQLYKIADKIIITSNPSINSTKSIIKQFKTLSGQRINGVFKPNDDILSRTNVVLTRVYDNTTINEIVETNLKKYAPVIAKFGNIDDVISEVQWYQRWDLIDKTEEIYEQLDEIIKLDTE